MTDRIDDQDHTTRAVVHLPGLDIAVEHSRDADAERISIHLQAVPSFAAFGNALDAANPFAFWARAAQLAWHPLLQPMTHPWTAFAPWMALSPWSPWFNAMRALPRPGAGETPPTVPEA